MANRTELREARKRAAEAVKSLRQIEALPRRVGQRVRWSNGVIWERVGDNAWRAISENGVPLLSFPQRYRSEHVASGSWERV